MTISLFAATPDELALWAKGWLLPSENLHEGQRITQLNPQDQSEIIIWNFRNQQQPQAEEPAADLQLAKAQPFQHQQLNFIEWSHLLRSATGKEPARIWGELAGQALVTQEPQDTMLMRVLPELWQPLLQKEAGELLFGWRVEPARICRTGWKAKLLGRYTGKTISAPELDDETKAEIIQGVQSYLRLIDASKKDLFLAAAP